MKSKHWWYYQTNGESYCVVDDGHTVSTSTVARNDKFSINKGIGVAVLRAKLGIDHPTFRGHAVTPDIASGMCCVDDGIVSMLAKLAGICIRTNKRLRGKREVWRLLDQFGMLVKINNNFTRLTKDVPIQPTRY